jgi:hypothetical protein
MLFQLMNRLRPVLIPAHMGQSACPSPSRGSVATPQRAQRTGDPTTTCPYQEEECQHLQAARMRLLNALIALRHVAHRSVTSRRWAFTYSAHRPHMLFYGHESHTIRLHSAAGWQRSSARWHARVWVGGREPSPRYGEPIRARPPSDRKE